MQNVIFILVLFCLAVVRGDAAGVEDKFLSLEKEKSAASERAANTVDRIKMQAKTESEKVFGYVNSATKRLNEIKSEAMLKLRRISKMGDESRKREYDGIENRINNEGSGMESHLAR